MSISDELMWRYYELLTDLTTEQIAALKNGAEKGERNPRDIKAELAKSVISDFYSREDAERAEEEFERIFKRKETPTEVDDWWVPYSNYKISRLLAEVPFLASSVADARRLVSQGAVRLNGERVTDANLMVDLTELGVSVLLQVGKKKFVRVRVQGAIGPSAYEPRQEPND